MAVGFQWSFSDAVLAAKRDYLSLRLETAGYRQFTGRLLNRAWAIRLEKPLGILFSDQW